MNGVRDGSGDLRGDPWLFLPGAKLDAAASLMMRGDNNHPNDPCQQN
jgi:hypothetical protein